MVKASRIAKDYTEAGAMNTLIGLWGFLSTSDQDSIFLTKSGEVGVVIPVEEYITRSLTRTVNSGVVKPRRAQSD